VSPLPHQLLFCRHHKVVELWELERVFLSADEA